eukprot:364469-Chlamydomonas_euryale.AAC.17
MYEKEGSSVARWLKSERNTLVLALTTGLRRTDVQQHGLRVQLKEEAQARVAAELFMSLSRGRPFLVSTRSPSQGRSWHARTQRAKESLPFHWWGITGCTF